NYKRAQTIHVLDASRSVPVVGNLLGDGIDTFVNNVKLEYDDLRKRHIKSQATKSYVTIEEARANRFTSDWDQIKITEPAFIGVKTFNDYPLEEIRKYIDWTPFFRTWELAGKYPDILEDDVVGEQARSLFDDANAMLDKIISEKWLGANAVIGIWPANSVGDDIEIYLDGNSKTFFHGLRQQNKKAKGTYNYCLSDFIAPKESGVQDYIGGFVVTAGLGIEEHLERFKEDHDDYNSILLKALADRLAEAFTELIHEKVRKEYWGYAADENLTNDDLITEKYKGIRPAPGYPACPDHTEKRTLFELLQGYKNAGVKLTESLAMYPAASVSGIYFAHPESRYFGLGKIQLDQVKDYAERKGICLEEAERWLSSNLAY
ncbi:MAG TPA: vitamin B12 dependent-methionine synthase activation domain-containing protein, partial [Ignavibacteria bacterium]|nr:vitamin B12 dependent-methionine synthase activation domain-containing protein [Ignavibacteria bacterium]